MVYVADQIVDEYPMGFRVPIAGPYTSATLIWSRAYAVDYSIDPSHDRVVVLGNAALVDSIVRPWAFPLGGTPDPNGGEELVPKSAFDPDGDVSSMQLYDDGTLLYRGDQLTDGLIELFAVPASIFWDSFESGDRSAWSASVP